MTSPPLLELLAVIDSLEDAYLTRKLGRPSNRRRSLKSAATRRAQDREGLRL